MNLYMNAIGKWTTQEPLRTRQITWDVPDPITWLKIGSNHVFSDWIDFLLLREEQQNTASRWRTKTCW